MGNLVTKITTNSVQLDESNVSDIVVYEKEQQVKKDKSPVTNQTKTGLFKSVFTNGLDPRSPSTFISRTPIQIFRTASSSKFNHQELNESLNESTVDLDILTVEEQESLNSNKDLVDAANIEAKKDSIDDENELSDPRSPTIEFVRTPIILTDKPEKNENNLVKKIADKLMSTKISNENVAEKTSEMTKKKTKTTEKNLIYEDDEIENYDRFSTPPKRIGLSKDSANKERTPLGCVANKTRAASRNLLTSTPKGTKIPIYREKSAATSASRIPRRIE